MLPKMQNAMIILFIILFLNIVLVAYNVVDSFLGLGAMPQIHANTLGLINAIVVVFGLIGLSLKSRQF
jgi:uncharacterized protein YebE (UPF0316 family)